MKTREIEKRLAGAVEKLAPNGFDAVLADARSAERPVILTEEPKRRSGWVRWAAGAMAALVLALAVVLGVNVYRTDYAVASTVALEVNPSLEIRVNSKEVVLEVIPKNDDAKAVIGDMDFRGSKLDITVNALVGSMVRHGYLSEMANSILVSVDSNDENGAALQEKLTREINDLFATDGFSGAVLSQTVRDDGSLSALAEEYGITPGKAQLIAEIVAKDSRYTFESLSGLSINDLNLILKSKVGTAEMETIAAAGTASDAGYIGKDAARSAALEAAGVSEAEVLDGVWIGMDWEDGVMVYEVEFNAGNWGYECEVRATDGRVLKCECEEPHAVTVVGGTDHHDDEHHVDVQSSGGTGTVSLTEEEAYRTALQHAGVREEDVTWWKVKLDRDDGLTVYEIEFRDSASEYEYKVDANSGAVVKSEKEQLRGAASGTGSAPAGTAGSDQVIGEAQAKAAALEHAGVSADSAPDIYVKLDWDDGRQTYDVKFTSGGWEYDYEIDAATGAVLKSEKEQLPGTAGGTSGGSGQISSDEAKRIAFEHAGVAEADVYGLKVKLDRDDGQVVYEVEFKSGSYEFEYDIDAVTGAILKSERDLDD